MVLKGWWTEEKVYGLVRQGIRIILLIAIFIEILNLNWLTLFVTVLAFVLTFVPEIIEKSFKVDLPIELEILTILFIYASIFLGEVKGYYTRFWWWDTLLHTTFGIALGFVGFMILYVLYKGNKIKASPILVAFFSFCFALALGALWEVFEFIMDQTLGLTMQKSGSDTMRDLIVDSIGALISAIAGFIYLKYGHVRVFDRILRRFKADNKLFFR